MWSRARKASVLKKKKKASTQDGYVDESRDVADLAGREKVWELVRRRTAYCESLKDKWEHLTRFKDVLYRIL